MTNNYYAEIGNVASNTFIRKVYNIEIQNQTYCKTVKGEEKMNEFYINIKDLRYNESGIIPYDSEIQNQYKECDLQSRFYTFSYFYNFILYFYRELEKNCIKLFENYKMCSVSNLKIKNNGENYEIVDEHHNLDISSILCYNYCVIDSTEVNKLLNSFYIASYPLQSGVSLITSDSDYVAYDRALGSIESDDFFISNYFVNQTIFHYSMII